MSSLPSRIRMHVVLAFVLVAAAVIAAVSVPSVAKASPLTSLDMILLLEPHGTQEPLLLVTGELPPEQPLPAEIVLPVPDGAQVEWAGDILGGPVAEDIPAEAVIETRDGVTVAVFTLTQSRVGQVEVTYPDAIMPVEGGVVAAAFEASMPLDADSIRMAVAVPPGLQAASLPEGTLTSQGPEGFIYYYTERGPVTSGDVVSFSLEYRPATLATSASTSGSAVSGEVSPILILLIAVVVAVAVLFVLVSRTRSQAAEQDNATMDTSDYIDGAEDSREETLSESREGPPAHPALGQADRDATAAPGLSALLTPKPLIAIGVVLVLAIAILVNLGGEDGQVGVTDVSGEWISQRISSAPAESESEFALQILCDCPPEVEALKMFDALRQVPGVAHASLEASTLTMRIQYDPAQVDEADIARQLRAAGYLQ